MDDDEAYQEMLRRLEEKKCKELLNGYYVAYDNSTLVCFTPNLEYLKSIRFSDSNKIVYSKIGEDEMYEL
jgi:hypothetical protein